MGVVAMTIGAHDATANGDFHCWGILNVGDPNTAWGCPVRFAIQQAKAGR